VIAALTEAPVPLASLVATGLVLFGAACAALRLVLGPSLTDRILALDYLAVLLALLAALLAIRTGEALFLDLAVVLSLMSFVAAVAFARYAERRGDVLSSEPER
jgi:multicomponent Na+:H+ antiporter subunit F